MTPRDAYLEVTTTRIIRALRPLRAKCECLATSRPIPPKTCTTYASSSRQKETGSDHSIRHHVAPLPLVSLGNYPVNNALMKVQSTKRITEVTEAFRNIVYISLGVTSPQRYLSRSSGARDVQRIPSLASLCCTVVGEHIESEVQAHRDTLENVSSFDDEDIAIITELYDSLPTHHRRFASNLLSQDIPPLKSHSDTRPYHTLYPSSFQRVLTIPISICLSWRSLRHTPYPESPGYFLKPSSRRSFHPKFNLRKTQCLMPRIPII